GAIQARMEAALARLLPQAHLAPARLHEAMRYAALEGGKRVRPLLVFAAGELADAGAARIEIAAAAVELIHAYSLVHDDLPCMDDDVLRRGKPTLRVEYDEATALLVGDALQSLAFQLLAEHRIADEARTQLEMVKILALAASPFRRSRKILGLNTMSTGIRAGGSHPTMSELRNTTDDASWLRSIENNHHHQLSAGLRANRVRSAARTCDHVSSISFTVELT